MIRPGLRAVLLAAGRGARLLGASPAIMNDPVDHPPKCLLAFDGITLLERHLRLLDAVGVTEVVLALGYRQDLVRAELARLGRHDVSVVVNDRYRQGSMLTAHVVAEPLGRGGDVLLMDADVLYARAILDALTDGRSADRLLIDRGFVPGDEPVKVCVRDGVPVEFSKRVPDGLVHDTIGESVGFFRLCESTARRFNALVAAHIHAGGADLPHEVAIRDLLLSGDPRFDIVDVTGSPWIEIDFPEDVERARRDVLPHAKLPDAKTQRP